eukprot:jgi/Botrbrau1/13129/Bobra.0187s0084.1
MSGVMEGAGRNRVGPARDAAMYECRAVSAVELMAMSAVEELLTGLAGQSGTPLHLHEVVMRMHREGGQAEVRLLRNVAAEEKLHPDPLDPASAHTWLVRHEGLPVRGKGLAELPASVRSVVEVGFSGGDVRLFWGGLGFFLNHELVKKGFSWSVPWGSHTLQVRLVKVQRLKEQGLLESVEQLSVLHGFLDITGKATDDSYAAVALAIGSLGEALEPYVTLRKP